MTENLQDPTALTPTPIKYNVLLMTAAVISCEAINEMDAAQRALLEGPNVLDPSMLQWVVKYVSDKPIYLGEPEDGSETVDVTEQVMSSLETPDTNAPNLEIVK